MVADVNVLKSTRMCVVKEALQKCNFCYETMTFALHISMKLFIIDGNMWRILILDFLGIINSYCL